MRSVRAAENSRIGIEINPNVRWPFQTVDAITAPPTRFRAQTAVGKPAQQEDNFFVVQKHAARRLHFDFRLAIHGVLKSWAVPKGPSLNPADKRLAVQTEDHPMDYGNFEGKIPQGNYGAGTVMVWDRGTYRVMGEADAGKQLQRGEIKFELNGEKLRGSFVLVKLKQSEKGNEWLLIKHKDAAVDPAWNIEEHEGSALTRSEEHTSELQSRLHLVCRLLLE